MNIENDLRYCHEGGQMVTQQSWIPRHPSEYYFAFIGHQIGCNNIKCGKCGRMVAIQSFAIITAYVALGELKVHVRFIPLIRIFTSMAFGFNGVAGGMRPWIQMTLSVGIHCKA
jgi:hypothetical protein